MFRYDNYGTADLLLTATDTQNPAITIADSDTQYGSAFYGSDSAKPNIDVPAGIKEIWIKCDIHFSSNFTRGRRFYFGHYSATLGGYVGVWNGTGYGTGNSSAYGYLIDSTPTTAVTTGLKVVRNTVQRVLLHMVSDASNGVIELTVNDSTYTWTGNVNNGDDFDCLGFYANSTNTTFSNVIVSDSQISINDNARVAVNVGFNVDTKRQVVNSVSAFFDTRRNLTTGFVFSQSFDTKRQVVNSVNDFFDTKRNVASIWSTQFDTLRRDVLPVSFNADSVRKVVRSVDIDFDTFRKVVRSINFHVDTLRKLPYTLIFDDQTFQSVNISISEQQLTDQVSFTSINHFDILEQVKGSYLDYHFNLRIENLSINENLFSCKCCSDIDELLYTQVAYKLSRRLYQGGTYVYTENNNVVMVKKPNANASAHINKIASILKKQPVLHFGDFTSTVDIEQSGVTYQDLISEIFGWTSRVPHKLINVFIRDDELYVIQRGYEQNIFDLSGYDVANLVIEKTLIRTSWGVSKTTIDDTAYGYRDPVLGNEIEDEEPEPEEPQEADFEEPTEESRILPEEVIIDENDIRTRIVYTYDDDGNVLTTSTYTTGGDVDKWTDVENIYEKIDGRKCLAYEITKEYESEPNKNNWELVDSKSIRHKYLEQGQQHVSIVDSEGNVNGSITTPARLTDKTTPFEKQQWQQWENSAINYTGGRLTHYTYKDGKKFEVLGYQWVYPNVDAIALYDSSFPVEGAATLQQITNELKWLNRKTQETVSFDIYDFIHVFDFNDKIIFNGNEYFVQSNSVTKDVNIVNKQSLQLVRWF